MSIERIDFAKVAPAAMQPFYSVEKYLGQCPLEPNLVELVKLRASQINGCGYCLDMHTKAARQNGENEQRLDVLNGWREVNLYSSRERAALAWTESLTLLPNNNVPDEVYEPLKKNFSETEIVDLTVLIAQINSWNRLAIALRKPLPVDAT